MNPAGAPNSSEPPLFLDLQSSFSHFRRTAPSAESSALCCAKSPCSKNPTSDLADVNEPNRPRLSAISTNLTMRHSLTTSLSLALALTTLTLSTLASGAEAVPPKGKVEVAKPIQVKRPVISDLARYQNLRLVIPSGIPEVVDINVPINGVTETLRLYRTSLRSASSHLLLDRGNGVLEEAPLPPHRTYRGTVLRNGASVAASVIDGKLWAYIDFPNDTYFVQPMSDFDATRAANEHIVYGHGDVALTGDHHCGNDDAKLAMPDWMRGIPTDPGESNGGAGGSAGNDGDENTMGGDGSGGDGDGGIAGTTPFMTEIAFDADFEFFQMNASNAVNTVNDIENVMNSVSLIYDRDVNINYEFTTFVIRTTAADPYTTTVMNDLLCEFRTKWNTTPESGIQRDVAQLFTGKAITGNVIGLAWLGVVCNQSGNGCSGAGNLAYSCVESRFTGTFDFRVSLSSHEIGHNWQAGHCDSTNPCNIMCSIINSCQGTTGANLKFSATEQAQITSYRNAVGCDVALPAPIALPFVDGFDASTVLNATNWIYSKGGAVTTAAVGEPSPTRSLNLDAASALDYGDDEVRSNFMLLAGLSTVYLAYSTEHRGVEAGKQLVVEFLNTALDWVVLNTITSDGVDQSTFASWQHTLPAAAKHNKFRVRFRSVVDAQDDDWFIDDVKVNTVILPANDECASATTITVGAHAFNSLTATDSAVALPASCDEGFGTIMRNDLWYFIESPCQGNMTVSTCNAASFNTRLSAYSLACPTTGPLIACNNDSAGCTGGTSTMTFPVSLGAAVHIRVGGLTGGGTGTLTVTCTPVVTCLGDIDQDGQVAASDLAELLGSWGLLGGDLNNDGTTDAADLSAMLSAWGPCS